MEIFNFDKLQPCHEAPRIPVCVYERERETLRDFVVADCG